MRDLTLHRAILGDFGHTITPESLILDFGCGDGGMVAEYRSKGLQAFGADVCVPHETEWLRPIAAENYRLPFADETFDFLFSNSVLEHVEDLDLAFAEMRRVLKPGGASLHLFPPRARPIEPHVHVPLGGILQNQPWLLLWAIVGVRNPFQRTLSFQEVARRNHDYLRTKTFYRSKRQLHEMISSSFTRSTFADAQMISHSYGKARHLRPIVKLWPASASWYGMFHQRCVFFEKKAL